MSYNVSPTPSRNVYVQYVATRIDGTVTLVGPDVGHPVISVTRDGRVEVGEPLDRASLAKMVESKDSLSTVILALASEVARLRWELEHVKARTP